ncbi:GNAT family N-acetyltransferase [Vagococcus zengguangii]|uniref:GNAT family N-acetyltransferase n=1 Tax=Vagococcus zengguangii TaxID=2571750 RepID=A0A4D7CU50_9ENTE|nr:GNAT family N-acetyltransferase [Vagococcus zengguangii]QCI85907.1 GNAT family N-acetyltransferase [Vagococcus zengguangii]TLG78397.1 GNAT family N-acetyltransferase [Vagococcus zengguangii]
MIQKVTAISEEQLEQITAIWLKTNIEVHDYIDPSYWHNHLSYLREELPNVTLFISLNDNQQMMGFIGIDDGYVAGLFVGKSHRNQGIGKELIRAAQAENQSLILSVYRKNKEAIAFYESQGFVIIEEQIDKITQEKEYVMKWQQSIQENR